MTMGEARSYCLKLECDRARSRRESAQGKFEASHQSLDRLIDTFEDPSKAAAFTAYLNARFPKAEATGVSLPRGAENR